MTNKLIVLDGLDGSGKTTQFELLKNIFKEDTRFITFPYYNSPSGKIISDYLTGKYNEEDNYISAFSASSFYAVDRYVSYKTDWGKDWLGGKKIISARYTSSNAIYQMTKIDKSKWDSYLEWLSDYEYIKLGLPKPDGILFLDMPVYVSQKLLSERYNGDETKKDIHESNIAFLNACREAALYVGKRQNWTIIPCSDGENPLPVEDINKSLVDKIGAMLNA